MKEKMMTSSNKNELKEVYAVSQGEVDFGGVVILGLARVNPLHELDYGIKLAEERALKCLNALQELKSCLRKYFSRKFLNKPYFGLFLGKQLGVLGCHPDFEGDLFFADITSKLETLSARYIREIESHNSERKAIRLLKNYLISDGTESNNN